jgi:hypothetical protein
MHKIVSSHSSYSRNSHVNQKFTGLRVQFLTKANENYYYKQWSGYIRI